MVLNKSGVTMVTTDGEKYTVNMVNEVVNSTPHIKTFS